jgi:hypothetical protein
VRRRLLNLLVLGFAFAWLNIVVPGHERGIVQLAGANSCPACHTCPVCQESASHSSAPAKNHGAATCAICFFAAHLSVATPIDIAPKPTLFLQWAACERIVHIVSLPALVPFDGRAPPCSAA